MYEVGVWSGRSFLEGAPNDHALDGGLPCRGWCPIIEDERALPL